MSWLDALLGKIFTRGVEVELAGGLNFTQGVTAVHDAANNRIDIKIDDEVESVDTGFAVRLLPQIDDDLQSSNATAQDIATVTLDDDTMYVFAVYCHAFAASHASETVLEFDEIIRRHGAVTGAESLRKVSATYVNPLSITGLELVCSGDDVIVRWTGHASTALRARVQVSYIKRPAEVPA